jgi:hypothetical protein
MKNYWYIEEAGVHMQMISLGGEQGDNKKQ